MNVSDLLRRPGSTRDVRLEVAIPGLESLSARVDEEPPVSLDLRLESLTAGVVANGRVSGRWSAVCSRCLTAIAAPFDLRFREVFEKDPVEEETYPIYGDEIDLLQPLRDSVVPELPGVPLCSSDCAGLCPACGANRNEVDCRCETRPVDPRWEALRDLEL